MRLKELRKKNNLTQKEVAEKLIITPNGYSYYENNINEPNIETLCKLADLYNVSLDYLVGRNFKNDLGYLSDTQKNAVKLIQQLNNQNLMQAIAYMSGLLVGQQ